MKIYLIINDDTKDRVQAVALTLEQAEKARNDFNSKSYFPNGYVKEYEVDDDNYCDVTKPYDPMANF